MRSHTAPVLHFTFTAMLSHYLLSCSISADVRQSVQIKFDDLKLPKSVIDTLEEANTVSIRPNLSNALKKELDQLRIRQRELYDGYCIHYGDSHFVTSSYFYDANELIKEIRKEAEQANLRMKEVWEDEFDRWQKTTESILRPLFVDDVEYKMAFEAYMRFFPTKEEYKKPIRVSVLGPLPVTLEKVSKPIEEDVDALIAYENSVNTQQVLQAAKQNAADRALNLGAQLLDDLDARHVSKIGKQQTGSPKKRGSWQITAERLQLISNSVPGFEVLTRLTENLLDIGNRLQAKDFNVRNEASTDLVATQDEIRKELAEICSSRDSSQGLEKLKQSLALSTSYKTLCEKIKSAENSNALNLLMRDVNLEVDIYEQRSKQLKKLIAQRKELIEDASDNIDQLISEVKETDATTDDLETDF
jgi:hypothetical protein